MHASYIYTHHSHLSAQCMAEQPHGPRSTQHDHIPYPLPHTYIVQLPIDRIYEHTSHNDKISFTFLLICISIILLIIALIVFLIVSIFFLVVKPKSPRFCIENFIGINIHDHTKYNFSIRTKNPNDHMGILYQEGGVSLSLRKHQIAIGKFPSFYHGKKTSMVFDLSLNFKNIQLPKEIEDKTLKFNGILLMNVPVKFKLWLVKTWSLKIVITCDITINAMPKAPRMVSQQCHNKIHL